jgi:hypothetical protein
MKRNSLSKWFGAGALAMSLAILPSALPAAAQTAGDPAATGTPGATTASPGTDPVFEAEGETADDGFDWGLLGLLGLIGLAGLAGRKNDDHDVPRYRTTDEAPTSTTPGSRY